MMREDQFDELHADAPLYAVNALDPRDAEVFEEHLADCPACQEEVAAFGEVLADLAASAPVQPPQYVRDELLARIHEEAASSPAAGPAGGAPAAQGSEAEEPTAGGPADAEQTATEFRAQEQAGPGSVTSLAAARQRRGARWPMLVAAAALAAVVGLGGWFVGTQQQEQQQQQLAQEQDRRADLLGAGDLTVEQIEVQGRPATLLVSPSQDTGMLVASDLPDPGEGREYQLWLMQDQTPAPDAHFSGGEVTVWLDGAVDDADAVAMTVEPAGGSPAPTTDPLAVVQL